MVRRAEKDRLDKWDNWEPPPIDPETEARLREIGVRRSTKSSKRVRVAAPKRPRWLAFLYRLFRIRERDEALAHLDDWEIPPLDAETEERLRAAGVRPATGSFANHEWPTVRKRPRWLAFLYRVLRIPDRD